ncbi:response regulator transcription factor [Vagococcus sp. BWB3-3]|uniref:Response regulator transcription factor n=1 Tax=Vagococcus allomyrinae TaxID=2794353 RepID=A0A940P8A5_9ENTE|nr:response regulator transcription factor [Vagococcus allomyrinae]MBP1042905.1 response regulator transcription factor [Vagococcus allomyrinae]
MKVYLLDDHVLFSKSLEIAFQTMDISITSFTGPTSFFDKIKHEQPDIVLLDIHMGEISGFDISKDILKMYPNIKVVFLSGFNLIEYQNEAIKSGAWGLLNKNLTIESLYSDLINIYHGINLLPSNSNSLDSLSEREKEILKCAAEGLKQQEIAERLHISRRTVNNHLLSINEKLQVNSTVSAIIQAIELGIIRVRGY